MIEDVMPLMVFGPGRPMQVGTTTILYMVRSPNGFSRRCGRGDARTWSGS